jgi:hypothetical protein
MMIDEHNPKPDKDYGRIFLGFILVLLACLLLALKLLLKQDFSSKGGLHPKEVNAYANKLQMRPIG